MKKKLLKYGKILMALTLIGALTLPSYATVGAADGSAFVTKAEFDAALSDFNARLTTFEAGINSKIDSQVSSYLDRNGIWNGKGQTLYPLADQWKNFTFGVDKGDAASAGRRSFAPSYMLTGASGSSGSAIPTKVYLGDLHGYKCKETPDLSYTLFTPNKSGLAMLTWVQHGLMYLFTGCCYMCYIGGNANNARGPAMFFRSDLSLYDGTTNAVLYSYVTQHTVTPEFNASSDNPLARCAYSPDEKNQKIMFFVSKGQAIKYKRVTKVNHASFEFYGYNARSRDPLDTRWTYTGSDSWTDTWTGNIAYVDYFTDCSIY